jgi:hypothetical protein
MTETSMDKFDRLVFNRIVSYCSIDIRLAFNVAPCKVHVPVCVITCLKLQKQTTRRLRNILQPTPEISRVVRRIDIANTQKSMVVMICKRKAEMWTEQQIHADFGSFLLMSTVFTDHRIVYHDR